MLPHEAQDLLKFARSKSKVVREADRLQPEFRSLPVACYVNVRGFALVARKKKKRYGPLRKTVGLTTPIVPAFRQTRQVGSDPATLRHQPRRASSRSAVGCMPC